MPEIYHPLILAPIKWHVLKVRDLYDDTVKRAVKIE
jgi:hypothetical protein